MTSKAHSTQLLFVKLFQGPALTLMSLIALATILLVGHKAQAQTFNVLYSFTGGSDGANPGGLVIDKAGNLYGTASQTVFKLTHRQAAWQLATLFDPKAQNGLAPANGVAVGPDGNLYWAGAGGKGTQCGGPCGQVVQLKPPAAACKTATCLWTQSQIYEFPYPRDGFVPDSNLTFDQQGNMYGTTIYGGIFGQPPGLGVLYKVSPSNGGWQGVTLHSFGSGYPDGDGWNPVGGLAIDSQGNLYGGTSGGGPYGTGTVYMESGYSESVIFPGDGAPGVVDKDGNLFGNWNGEVYELSPSDNGWIFTVVYSPSPGVIDAIDNAGNLYGTTRCCLDPGSVFKLSRSGGGWAYTDLYDFTGGSDGYGPGSLLIDPAGNLYGTTFGGGNPACNNYPYPPGCGVVFEISPN